MHKKFKEKMDMDNLLCEMEYVAHNIEGIYFTSCHLFDFCNEHNNIEQIRNMTFIVENMKNNLLCLNKELQSIVNNQKYNKNSILDKVKENMDNDNYIILED